MPIKWSAITLALLSSTVLAQPQHQHTSTAAAPKACQHGAACKTSEAFLASLPSTTHLGGWYIGLNGGGSVAIFIFILNELPLGATTPPMHKTA